MESLITSEIIREVLENPPRSLDAIQAELLFLDGAYILHSKEDNIDRFKYLSSTSLKNAFSGVPVDSGWLDSGVIRAGSNSAGSWVVKFIPPKIHTLISTEFGDLTVPLPAMVFIGANNQYQIWALKTKTFDPDAPLFYAPLSNVYIESGKICWGSNTPPECSPQSMNAAWKMFITSPFNNHLSNSKSQLNKDNICQYLAYLHSKKSKKYPISDLRQPYIKPTTNSLVYAIANE
jgi:PRTRC genetic system protein B